MNLRKRIKSERLYFDGGMGTILQSKGLALGELPENWNLTHSEIIEKIHLDYLSAGADIIKTNTFGANSFKFNALELEQVIKAGVSIAKKAVKKAKKGYVALDIGPTGKLLKPYGDLDFEEAVQVFSAIVNAGKQQADLILIETMNDSYETKAAVLAAKENSDLPIFVTNVYGLDGKLMTGADPKTMIALLEGLGVDALGMNCSLGPKQMKELIPIFAENSSLPIIVNPNAGLPRSDENGNTVYDVDEKEFALLMQEIATKGGCILGGCCGTTPNYIGKMVEKTKQIPFSKIYNKNITAVTSYCKCVSFGERPILIGERINPTGKKRFKQALREKDIPYILQEGISQQGKGVDILDVNVGLPEIDEPKLLEEVVVELQSVTELPLQIDTPNTIALEKALRRYNGKAMINSVNGKMESMETVFPLVKKYGGVVVALTLDENGIPETVEGRIAIARKILSVAKKYKIEKKNIIFDTLTMAVSSDTQAAKTTLKSMQYIRNRLNCYTSLGVSNISFGLPSREIINSTFFALALENGLSAAIINPFSIEMQKTYYSFLTLHNLDEKCLQYIKFITQVLAYTPMPLQTNSVPTFSNIQAEELSPLKNSIIKGLKENAAKQTEELLKTMDSLSVIDKEIIPALDIVGKGFEEKTVYLPQLLMSAESAKSAFDVIKNKMSQEGKQQDKKCKFVIATVKGDIHDIGKNIVKTLLENYGFDVIDLGRDILPNVIVNTVIEEKAPLVGLSALMTTTVPSMAETIKLLKEKTPWVKIVVGGAVLTQEYADSIGADKYAKDAMESVRYAEKIFNEIK